MIKQPQRRRGESGNSLFLGVLGLVWVIPFMGLTIDTSFLYITKGRLQAAVDGASLGAARALNLGTTLAAQQTAAAQNAANWFYANFPPNTYATTNTLMSNGSPSQNNGSGFLSSAGSCPVTNGCGIYIHPDTSNPQLDHVQVSATTHAPTWFMHWFGLSSTTLSVSSDATRRALVAMIVLDRSGSMCMVNGSYPTYPCSETNSNTPCAQMIEAAKLFTGQFSEGRDYIGLISFAANAYVHTAPTQNFQTALGFTSSFASGTGAIDNIVCDSHTNTAEGIAMGYNLLYQTGLPLALNVLLVETDGMPNGVTMNFFDSANSVTALSASSGCKDTAGNSKASGKFSLGSLPKWFPLTLNLAAAPFLTTALPTAYTSVPQGMVGMVASDDPGGSNQFEVMYAPWNAIASPQSPQSPAASTTKPAVSEGPPGPYNNNSAESAPGCAFTASGANPLSPGFSSLPDFVWFPATDVFGNQLNPALNPYQSVTMSGSHVANTGWANYHAAVLNAADNAAYQARANTTNPAYVFTIGLGGDVNGTSSPPDPVLLQRLANDPNGDLYNTNGPEPGGGYYLPCNQETTAGSACVNYPSQNQGTFIYAPTTAELSQAFIKIASQILSLAK